MIGRSCLRSKLGSNALRTESYKQVDTCSEWPLRARSHTREVKLTTGDSSRGLARETMRVVFSKQRKRSRSYLSDFYSQQHLMIGNLFSCSPPAAGI